MSTSSPQPLVVAQFRNLIWQHLDTNMMSSAIFTAERLYAYDNKNPDSAFLLALCLFRNGQYRQAENLTKIFLRHVGCAYLYAQCALELGASMESMAVSALDACKRLWVGNTGWNQHSDTDRRAIPDAGAIYCVLGKLHFALNDQKKAVESFVSAVKINPFLWEAVTGLCDTGVQIKVNNIYKPTAEMLEAIKIHVPEDQRVRNLPENQPDPFTAANGYSRERSDLSNPNNTSFLNRLNEGSSIPVPTSHLETPTSSSTGANSLEMLGGTASHSVADKPPPIARKTRAAPAESGIRKVSRTSRDANSEIRRPVNETNAPTAPVRKSARLNTLKFSSSRQSTTDREVGRISTRDRDSTRDSRKRAVSTRSRTGQMNSATLFGQAGERNRASNLSANEDVNMSDIGTRSSAMLPPSVPKIDHKREEVQTQLLDLFRKFANAYFSMNKFACEDVIRTLAELPAAQRETPWVLCTLAKAYYEMANYPDAEKLFLKVRNIDPVRTEDMEVFSTVLWHQRKDVDLSYLAHELIDVDRNSPEAWCALGNCFSLQRDHDQALRCFKRATSFNPKLAYAFTLQGHEHVSNEEYEKALISYRSAIAADQRHYNAWYGLGKVYEKMGKYDAAEKHFKSAVKINPNNPVLVCCVGMTLEKVRDYKGALKCYNTAVKMAPRSALSRFKKARTLMALQEHQAALEELMILKDIAPDEANVHFLLGRIYKALRDRTNALKYLTIALNLDPKAGHLIKEVIENLDDDDDDYLEHDSEVLGLMDAE